jgi:RNA polymerase sigma-70 factor (ECF subfamily)
LLENEKDIIHKAKQGDSRAFDRLVDEYGKKIYNTAYKYLGNYNDAGEIAQEVFIKVYKAIKDFKEESLFSTWIYRIAVNVCMDELRKRKNSRTLSMDEIIYTEDGEVRMQWSDKSEGPEAAVVKKELRTAVHSAIRELNEDYRIVIILREFNGLSYEEIGKVLNCPTGTVKSRINRA